MGSKNVLIIANSEIFYHARLLKAADFLYKNGFVVTVFNPITGLMDRDLYEELKSSRSWQIIEYDISKSSFLSKWRWFWTGIVNKVIKLGWQHFKADVGFPYYFNKGIFGFSSELAKDADFILINLVDSLPFAKTLKNKYGCRIIYDSQELFTGQFSLAPRQDLLWVETAENKYFPDVDILLATTNAMLQRLIIQYNVKVPSMRVRNLPLKRQGSIPSTDIQRKDILNLVWHGMTVFFFNRRGVHVLVEAVALCKSPVTLTLQGIINDEQQKIFNDLKIHYNLQDKLFHKKPASPDNIVESLYHYDIGLIGELPHEDNERLTSSNKLFDFINAGLAVVAPNVEGLVETVDYYKVGLTYEPGDVRNLSNQIDKLYNDQQLLLELRNNARTVSSSELFWENDFQSVAELLMKIES